MPPESTLFRNAKLLTDGARVLGPSSDVLVNGNRIAQVSSTPIAAEVSTTIDAGGKTMMPGLIDAHAHITGLSLSPKNISYSESEIVFAASEYLQSSLMDGFTTIREAGGADYRIAQLLEAGTIVGPRLFYSGRALTQTGGGADFRAAHELTEPSGRVGPFSVMSVIVDGVDEVRRAAREELRRGATQIKLFASGGVVFPSKSHPTNYEFSLAEIEAAVEEAAARGTYVMAHVYTDEGVRRCLEAGVRSIEHANFITEHTVAMMAERRAFFDPTFISLVQRIESAPETGLSTTIVDNLKETVEEGHRVYRWARSEGVPIALGTDLWGADAQKSQLRELEMRVELESPAEIIRSATSVNAELLMAKGELGTIAPGAYADLLIVEGDPLTDIGVLSRPQQKLKLIMKDGVIYKNQLGA
jgi:imidazolonepropionase-like amidohydrolase